MTQYKFEPAQLSERRQRLLGSAPICPECSTPQVELIDPGEIPARWKCRHCQCQFSNEPGGWDTRSVREKVMYRHKKSGGLYFVNMLGFMESTTESVVIYTHAVSGITWVRPVAEFTEKFERIEPYL